MTATAENLPASIPDDGFDYDSDDEQRLIQGARYVCDVTQPEPWLQQPGSIPLDVTRERLVLTTRTVLRRWDDKRVVEFKIKLKGQAFPSEDELNSGVPKNQWRKGPSGKPQGPWQMTWLTYLLDVISGERGTFVTTSVGGRICVSELRDDVAWMRQLRGSTAAPVVLLGLKPFPTNFGMKQRPLLQPVRWVELGAATEIAGKQLEHKPELKALPIDEERRAAGFITEGHAGSRVKLNEVKPTSTKEAIDDEMPPWDDDVSDVGTGKKS
jgi:hypothetical protein